MLDQHLTTDDMHFFTRLRMSIDGFGGNFNVQEASGRVGVDVRGTSRRSGHSEGSGSTVVTGRLSAGRGRVARCRPVACRRWT